MVLTPIFEFNAGATKYGTKKASNMGISSQPEIESPHCYWGFIFSGFCGTSNPVINKQKKT
jgi:hypothetical protein